MRLRGYRDFVERVVPSENREIPVRMVRSQDTGVATTSGPSSPPAGTSEGAGARDAGGTESGTVSGRLGTTVVTEYE